MTEETADEGWKDWARILEEVIRPRVERAGGGEASGQPWQSGDVPPDGRGVYVVADGFYSSSSAHWIERLAGRFEEAGCVGSLCGYSYAGRGLTYSTLDTGQSLRPSARILVDYLRVCPDQTVLVGFSLGTVVILLGMASWLDDPAEQAATEKVKSVVLVAPAHAASPLIARSYEEWLKASPNDRAGEPRRIPALVRQFASSQSSLRREATGAYSAILGRGIPLDVLHWPGDRFTPYVRPDISSLSHLLQEIPILTQRQPGDLRSAIARHISIRTEDEVLAEVAVRVAEPDGPLP